MNHPTEEQIFEAAETSQEAKKVLKKLYPELFSRKIKPGEIYSWGTADYGNCGLVIEYPAHTSFLFVNFRTGISFTGPLSLETTKSHLERILGLCMLHELNNVPFKGKLSGPKQFSS